MFRIVVSHNWILSNNEVLLKGLILLGFCEVSWHTLVFIRIAKSTHYIELCYGRGIRFRVTSRSVRITIACCKTIATNDLDRIRNIDTLTLETDEKILSSTIRLATVSGNSWMVSLWWWVGCAFHRDGRAQQTLDPRWEKNMNYRLG